MIAVLKGIEGDNERALADMERLSPLVYLVAPDHPITFYSYANSLAVELSELGRIEEARHASEIALGSPFARAYPEWRETAKDIALKACWASRSTVAVAVNVSESEDVLQALPVEHSQDSNSPQQNYEELTSLLPFRGRQASPSDQQSERLIPKLNAIRYLHLSVGQKRALLVDIAQAGDLSEEVLDRMLEVAGVIGEEESAGKPKTINLEQKSTLEELISLWLSGELNPDDFATVMSALRDCDDELRRKDIINKMISYAFYETRDRMESEDQWRQRVEARLEEQKQRQY